jgi:N utilization substance protein A
VSRKIKIEPKVQPIARSEILQIADIVARDKGIEREDIIEAMECAILKTAQMKFGIDKELVAEIDNKTGEISVYRILSVVEDVEDPGKQLSLPNAKKMQEDAKIGDVIRDKLPALEFGRVAAQAAKQIIMQKIRTAERKKQYEEFSGRVGEIITGLVKRVDYAGVIIDIGRTDGVIRKSEMLPNEVYRIGDRIKVLLSGLNEDETVPLLQLSRTHPDFLRKLFEQEVPEIYDGTVRIVAVARDPGSKSKIAVTTSDSNVDPIGACIGVKGSRIQAVINELKGEKLDVVLWSDNPAMFIVNSLAPTEVVRIIMEETGNKVTAVISDEQLSAAIGRRGQNVRLISKLTGWTINVMSSSDDIQMRTKETGKIAEMLRVGLDVDDLVARLLLEEGFVSIEDIASSQLNELAAIDGFDSDLAQEIQKRATAWVERKREELKQLGMEKGVSQELMQFELLRPELLEMLIKADVKTLDDLGDLSTDEVLDITGDWLSEQEAQTLIMKVRENWFKEDKKT